MKKPDAGRRSFLKKAVLTSAAALTGTAESARAETVVADENWYGMLYDSTRCVGCKTCMVACKEANHLPPDLDKDRIHDAPVDLSSNTRTLIKLYKDGEKHAYIKVQCMHCLDPSCVSVCPVGAMKKDPETGVVYVDDSCLGCRYCQMACPFNVPRFEWNSPVPKKISKCDMCWFTNLKEGKQPACCEVCPNQAIVFGRRKELLEEAKERIRKHPDRYIPRIYGESEVGGTGVLYLAGVEFEKLGLPTLPLHAPPRE